MVSLAKILSIDSLLLSMTSGRSRLICDLSHPSALSRLCEDFKPDLLIHCAVSLQSTDNNLAMYYSLENASNFCGKCIMIGSGVEYSHQRYILNERRILIHTHFLK